MLNPDRYLYPPRAKLVIPFTDTQAIHDLQTYGYHAQYKLNDTRLLLKYLPDGRIQLWNRHAQLIQNYTPSPQLHDQLHALPALLGLEPHSYHLLDGGLLHHKHPALKHTIALWDILVRNGQHLKHTNYQDRHHSLHQHTHAPYTYPLGTPVGHSLTPDIFVPHTIPPNSWHAAWASLTHENQPHAPTSPILEGLVMKRGLGLLGPGTKPDNNSDWMVRSRVWTKRHQF